MFTSKIEKSDIPLAGIKCEAKNCYYHGNGDHCMASQIEVGPYNATNCSQTDCTTFQAKQ